MLSTNSKIALLARATSAKHNNSSKTEQVITLQTSGNVSRLRRTTKLTRKMTHSRGTRLTQKKVTPKRKNMRVQPASPDASSPCQPVTPESDEPSLGSLLYPNLRQAQRDWADKQARTLTSEMEAESFDC